MSRDSFVMNLNEVATAVNGQLTGENVMVHGVSTDSRTMKRDNLFIALTGPNFDGHKFVDAAVENGAGAAITERKLDIPCPQVVVEDTRIALGKLAHAWRNKFSIPVIAVTGSNGKTTVKEMMTAILSVENTVLATQGNLNNDIGVPLTLFRLGEQHQYAVIEMGANHAGEIAYLTNIARPDVAMITNAGPAHLEGFGSLEGVARAKGEIYSGLSENGTAIINADDRFNPLWHEYCRDYRTLTFALDNPADITASWSVNEKGSVIYVTTPVGEVSINLPLLGRHNVMNALAAIAATLAAGISLSAIKSGLESLQPVKGRLQIKNGVNGSRLIDDTYNANPASLNAALDVLSDFTGQHFLALGDMGELGPDAEQLHHEAGKQARNTGVDKLFTVGDLAKHAALGFGDSATSYTDQPEMINAIANQMNSNVTLLVKGSRLMHMERVVDALTVNGETC